MRSDAGAAPRAAHVPGLADPMGWRFDEQGTGRPQGWPELGGRARHERAFIAPQDAGRINRSRLIEELYLRGPSTRAELARLGGTTRATVGAIVQPLLAANVLDELEPLPAGSSGGKPARPLWFSHRAPLLGAVHVLPHRIELALVGVDGTVRRERRVPLAQARLDPHQVLVAIATGLRELVDDEEARELLGIGIAIGGTVDTTRGEVLQMALRPELNGLPVADAIEREFSVPVLVDLHPRAQALGDMWFGAGRGYASFASLYIGEAIGAGFVFDRRIHSGVSGAGGEAGHTVVDRDGEPCVCGRRGCWETIATHRWLRARATQLGMADVAALDAAQLQRMANGGAPGAQQLVGEYIANLALGMANICQLLAPEAIIVHGDVARLGEGSLAQLKDEVRQASDRRREPAPALVAVADESHATVLGAAALVLSAALDLAL